ncbi:ATP-binding protein [Streptomyces sp. NPDC007369]|uniref:ATP-binding protein n=1 Tax=Streptomyces sp. NPDC007369 TaxID=3154589 RepID=UPI00340DCCBE
MRDRYFARSRQTVAAARQFAAETLHMWGVTRHRDDLLLCVSELASNALRHGVAPGRYYRVRLIASATTVRLEVHDSGPGLSRTRIGDGMGLRIVEAVSDRWGALPRSPGKSVWCEFGGPVAEAVEDSPSRQETAYLLRSPHNAQILTEPITELDVDPSQARYR